MKKIFSSELFWFTFFSLIILILAFIPFFYQVLVTPKGQISFLLHNNLFDFPMFVSVIRQAQEGHLTQVQRLTSEPQFGTWIHMFYLVVGWITGPFKIDPGWAYHLSRFVTGFMLLWAFYLFIKMFFKEKVTALSVFFLTVFAGGFPRLKLDQGIWYLIDWPYMNFFSGFDVIRRAAFLPHGMMRDFLFLIIIICWIKLLLDKKNVYLWLAIFCGFFLGFHSPIHSLLIYLLLNSYFLILLSADFFHRKNFSISFGYLKQVLLYDLITIPASVYLYWVFENTPWKIVKDWEAPQHPIFSVFEYGMGVGPLFFLALPVFVYFVLFWVTRTIGLISNIRAGGNRQSCSQIFSFGKNFDKTRLTGPASMKAGGWREEGNPAERSQSSRSDDENVGRGYRTTGPAFSQFKYYALLFIPLFTFPFLFSYVGQKLGLTNFRFLGVPLQVFFGVMGGMLFASIIKLFSGSNIKKRRLFLILFTVIIFLLTSPSYLVSYRIQFKENMPPIAFNTYPRIDFFAGYLWLGNNTKRDDIVLSDMATSNWIPAYSGNSVYLGHPVSTVDAPRKKEETVIFYKTVLSSEKAHQFLKDKHIKYVIWGYDEWSYGGNPDKYADFLKLRFETSEIKIYEVL